MKEKELENKIWHRFYKVVATLVVVAAFFAPSLQKGFSGGSFIDGIISAVIWCIGFIILEKVIVYIIYGGEKKDPQKAD